MPSRAQIAVAAGAAAAVVAYVIYKKKLKPKEIIRAALDIGSGEHKLVVAAIDAKGGIRVLHSEVACILLQQDLNRPGSDGNLSPDALKASARALHAFRDTARALGATQMSGVATAVFRRARNGGAYLAKARQALGIRLKVVDQRTEGKLGYLTAVAASRAAGCTDPVVSWDSGGGSFQIAASVDKRVKVYEGPIGNADAYANLRDLAGGFEGHSPNPASKDTVEELVIDLCARLPRPEPWLKKAIASKKVVCFGHRSSVFRLAADTLGTPDFGPQDVRLALDAVLGLKRGKADDGAIATWLGHNAARHAHAVAPRSPAPAGPYPEPHLVVPKLALLLAVLEELEIPRVHYEEANGSCLGVLLHEPLWGPPSPASGKKEIKPQK